MRSRSRSKSNLDSRSNWDLSEFKWIITRESTLIFPVIMWDQDKMTSLDAVLEDIGVCGPFQIVLVVTHHMAIVLSTWGMMMMAFGAYNPGWNCLDGDGGFENASAVIRNESQLEPTNYTPALNVSAIDNNTGSCSLYEACRNVSFSPGSSTVTSEWGLVCDKAWVLKLIFSSHMAGVLGGAYVAGQIGETLGRKASLYGLVALHGISNLVAVFSPSWEMFTAVRFFIGLASGGVLLPAYTTPLEFIGQFWRGIVSAMPIWNIGSALFAMSVLVLKDWRDLHLLAAVLSAVVFLPVFWVPESFRWLAVHGRDKHAIAIVTKIARMNGRSKPSLDLIVNMAENERRRALYEGSDRYTYFDLFRDRRVCKITIIITLVWTCLNIIYYGISFGIQALSGNFYVNFLFLSVMELPTPLLAVPAVSFLTRRWESALPLFLVALACFGITATNLAIDDDLNESEEGIESQTRAKIVLAFAIVAKIGVIVSWNVTLVFIGELFPTAVRNLGIGFANATARIGSFLGAVFFPQEPAWLYLAMIVLGFSSLTSFGLLLLLPETKGAPLEDTLRSKRQFEQSGDIVALTNGQSEKDKKDEEIVTDDLFQGNDQVV